MRAHTYAHVRSATPRVLAQADNTAREHKHQGMMLSVVGLSRLAVPTVAGMSFNMIRHTHHIVDQRFSIMGTELEELQELQTLSQFMTLIRVKITSRQGRQIHVEKIEMVHAWFSRFALLGICKQRVHPCHGNPKT